MRHSEAHHSEWRSGFPALLQWLVGVVVIAAFVMTFVVQAFDPQRRGIELALPGFAKVAGEPTAETVELLRTSGYWDRLVGAADDPESDPCSLIIAVTKVDDVASEEWRKLSRPELMDSPPERA